MTDLNNGLANNIQVLETDDFLYYVIFGKPDVIKEKAVKKAEQLQEKLKFYLEPFELRPTYQELEKIVEKLKKEYIDCDEYPPLTKWFKELLETKDKGN